MTGTVNNTLDFVYAEYSDLVDRAIFSIDNKHIILRDDGFYNDLLAFKHRLINDSRLAIEIAARANKMLKIGIPISTKEMTQTTKLVVNYTDKKGTAHSVPVNDAQAAIYIMTNSDAVEWSVTRINSEPNYDAVKAVIEHVISNKLVKNITSILMLNNKTAIVADCNHDNGNGIVMVLKAIMATVNTLDYPAWKVAGIKRPEETGPVHFGKGLKQISHNELIISSDSGDCKYILSI